MMEEKQLCSPSYTVILRGYHRSKEAVAHMHTCYQYDFCKLLLCLLSPFSFKVRILHSIFYRHELVIKYQLRQCLSPRLSAFPSPASRCCSPGSCLAGTRSRPGRGCPALECRSLALRSSHWGSAASLHCPAAA